MDLQELRAGVLQLLTLRPCHITGMHTPDHHLTSTCRDQQAAALDELLAELHIDPADIKHALHGNCYGCHSVPSQEEYREQRRQTHRWAGVDIPPELAAPADDAPRPGDTTAVLAFVTDGSQTWYDLAGEAIASTGLHRDRVTRAIRTLIDFGDIEEHRSGCGSPYLRRKRPATDPPAHHPHLG